VWTNADLNALGSMGLDRAFAPEANLAFYVFQSNLELLLADTVQLLRPYIEGSADITAEEKRRWARHTRAFARRTLRYHVVARLRSPLRR
jgi:hypothetical protein